MKSFKDQLLVLLILLFSSGLVNGETLQLPVIDLYGQSLNCRLADDVKKQLNVFESKDLVELIESEKKEVEELLSGDMPRKEKKVLRAHLKLLTELHEMTSPERELNTFFDQLCLNGEDLLKSSFKGIGMATNLIGLTLGFPFRYLSRVISGARYGVRNEQRPLSSYEIMGDRRNRSMSFFLLYRTLKLSFGSSPLFAPLLITPFVNSYIMNVCANDNLLSDEDKIYCKKFLNLKKVFFQKADLGENLGVKLHIKKKHSSVDVWVDEVNDENFCEYLYTVAERKTPSMKAQEFREVLIGQLNPGGLARPDYQYFHTPDSAILKSPLSGMIGMRNIVVSLSPQDSIIQEMSLNGRWDEYLDLEKRVSDETKHFNKLYRLKDLKECIAQKKKFGFSYKSYADLKHKLENYKNESLYKQHQVIQKVMKSLKRTHLAWELVPSNTLNTVRDLMQSGRVANIIIITHSVGDYKKMIDTHFNQYPSTFFKSISPMLMSLSFYTCHSQNILETYKLKELFDTAPSIYPKRLLSFVQKNDILSDGETVPLEGFGDYLKFIDDSLFKLKRENLASHAFITESNKTFTSNQCSISLENIKVNRGSLSLILNREFIGTINSTDNRDTFYFPCHLLNSKNTLLFQNSSLLDSLLLNELPTTVKLNGESPGVIDWKNYVDQAGNYSSTKVTF